MEWTGSPVKKSSSSFTIFDENKSHQPRLKRTTSAHPLPLTTSKLANRFGPPQRTSTMDIPVSEILSNLDAQSKLLKRQTREVEQNGNMENVENMEKIQSMERQSNDSVSPLDSYTPTILPTDSTLSDAAPCAAEFSKMKRQLEDAKERMALMNLEITQSRMAQFTMEEAVGSPFPDAQILAANMTGHSMQGGMARPHPYGNVNSRAPTPFGRGNFHSMPQMQHHGSNEQMSNYPRPPSSYGPRTGYTPPPMTHNPFQAAFAMPNGVDHNRQPPIGTRLSPTATEFGFGRSQWGAHQPQLQSQLAPSTTTYVNTTEPLNYRRLLDRSMSCNWKYIVDKIVCNNDQQASIFLQQKLKVGTPDQKHDIVQAIIDQAFPLMINRFGNFLVQRCFEHGSPEQIILIGEALRHNTLTLSMDAFGCHVIQKAFDSVPEEYKAMMVHELLHRVPETVIHRYACHVWQKLFELRWSDSPPQIMKEVNKALRGMWHEVALGETGSLVVQNIFENCLEEDKRPCISEVLSSIDVVAHGQFGNWCIQHICEHGSVPDRTRAIDHVIRFATEYSMDQFASKVVEKCLKIGGNDFLDRYLDRICEARPDRPRMPLIDISGDQYGNYLIQYILTNGDPQRKEVVAAHIRKHMVSLRGSKYGSRVAMLCCNPAFSTRPGPPAGLPMGRSNGSFNAGGDQRYGSDPRQFPNERPFGERPYNMGRGGYGNYR